MSTFRDVTARIPPGDAVVASRAPAPAPAPDRPRRHRGRRIAGVGALLLVAAAVVAIVVVAGDDGPARTGAARSAAPAARPAQSPQTARPAQPSAAELPAPASSALTVPSPASVPAARRPTATWAPVRRAVAARSAPSSTAPVVARLSTQTAEGTSNIVQVIGRREVGGELWVRARLAVLPNGTTGWLPRAAVGGMQFVRTRLVVRLGARTATLVRDGEEALRVRVAVGGAATPTPTGSFYVRNRLAAPSDPALGPVAFGTSARAGTGYIGIHGTNRPEQVPGDTSEGSIAMRNADVRRLARLMPVGTPVVVRS